LWWDPNVPENRTVITKHGILVQGNIVGDIGGFNFNNLLIQLTASLTLLATATFGVNCMASQVLKYKKYYSRAMVDQTADFSQVGHLEAMPDEELHAICRRRFIKDSGDRTDLICRLVMDDYAGEIPTPQVSHQASQDHLGAASLSVAAPASRELLLDSGR